MESARAVRISRELVLRAAPRQSVVGPRRRAVRASGRRALFSRSQLLVLVGLGLLLLLLAPELVEPKISQRRRHLSAKDDDTFFGAFSFLLGGGMQRRASLGIALRQGITYPSSSTLRCILASATRSLKPTRERERESSLAPSVSTSVSRSGTRSGSHSARLSLSLRTAGKRDRRPRPRACRARRRFSRLRKKPAGI